MFSLYVLFSGTLYLTQQLNYQKVQQIFLTVEVHDLGLPRFSNNTSVTIDVIEVPDNNPYISPNYAMVKIDENILKPTSLITVTELWCLLLNLLSFTNFV